MNRVRVYWFRHERSFVAARLNQLLLALIDRAHHPLIELTTAD